MKYNIGSFGLDEYRDGFENIDDVYEDEFYDDLDGDRAPGLDSSAFDKDIDLAEIEYEESSEAEKVFNILQDVPDLNESEKCDDASSIAESMEDIDDDELYSFEIIEDEQSAIFDQAPDMPENNMSNESEGIQEIRNDIMDFALVSLDPPKSEVEEKTAFQQLYDYMCENNYGLTDSKEYMNDPNWQSLIMEAFPDYQIPSEDDSYFGGQLEYGLQAIEDNVEALRDDLRDKGLIDGRGMEALVLVERDFMQKELERGLSGDLEYIYELPDYGRILDELRNGRKCYDFSDIPVDKDSERLSGILSTFDERDWNNMGLSDRKERIEVLNQYLADTIGLTNIPEIDYYYHDRYGDYGAYTRSDNKLHINEYMLDDNREAVDTVAHELWHAHQYDLGERLDDRESAQYFVGFDQYIRPSDDIELYQNQMIESEARAFAEEIKRRIV